jgi:uncharacterized protein YndB with AHSA1/START domain
MQSQNFTCTFTVEQSPTEVFDAINNVRAWWTGEIEGDSDEVGDEFSYRYSEVHYSRQKVAALVPEKRVVWQVVDAHLAGPSNPGEWIGTEITFDITPGPDGTAVRFSHLGLSPKFECFDSCSNAWGFFVNGSLQQLILTGKGPASPPWA